MRACVYGCSARIAIVRPYTMYTVYGASERDANLQTGNVEHFYQLVYRGREIREVSDH